MMTPNIRKAASFYRVGREDLAQCVALARLECERDATLDLERQVLSAVRRCSNRNEVRTVSIDDESINIEAIEAEALEQQRTESVIDLGLNAASARAALNVSSTTLKNFLMRLADGRVSQDDVDRWLPRAAEIRAMIEGRVA